MANPHQSCAGGTCGAPSSGESRPGADKWAFPFIDVRNIICLNESVDGAGQLVVKPFDKRSTCVPYVESCDDPELVVRIPFAEGLRLHSLVVGTGADESRMPKRVLMFVDRDDVTCGEHGLKPTQAFDLVPDALGNIEYPLPAHKFSNPASVTLHFLGTIDGDDDGKIRVSCIGFKGETTGVKRGVVITVYESLPSGKDVKAPGADSASHQLEGA